jgi:hypothetical protein
MKNTNTYIKFKNAKAEVYKICASLQFGAAEGSCLRTLRDNISVPSSRVKQFWAVHDSFGTARPSKMEPIGRPAMSVRYYPTLRKIPKERRSHLHCT